jgi:hypothetical protein
LAAGGYGEVVTGSGEPEGSRDGAYSHAIDPSRDSGRRGDVDLALGQNAAG